MFYRLVINSLHIMEIKYSLRYTQVSNIWLYPKLHQTSLRPKIIFLADPHQYYASIFSWSFQVASFLPNFPSKPCIQFSSPAYMPCFSPISPFSFRHPSNLLLDVPISWNSSLRHFHHSVHPTTLIGPNILLSVVCSNIRGHDKMVSFTILWLILTLKMVAAGPR